MEANQRIDQYRRNRLIVADPASVKIAALLGQHERIARPFGAWRGNYVNMRDQQDGLGRGIAAGQNCDQPAVPGVLGRGKRMDIGGGKAAFPHRHCCLVGGGGATAGRKTRVGFDQRFVERAERGGVCGCGRRRRQPSEQRAKDRSMLHALPSRDQNCFRWPRSVLVS